MESKKFDRLIKQLQELENKLDKMLKTEDVNMNQADILYSYAEDISDKLKSFNQYEIEDESPEISPII